MQTDWEYEQAPRCSHALGRPSPSVIIRAVPLPGIQAQRNQDGARPSLSIESDAIQGELMWESGSYINMVVVTHHHGPEGNVVPHHEPTETTNPPKLTHPLLPISDL